MANKYAYNNTDIDEEKTARAMAKSLKVSPKHCVEISNAIRGMEVTKAKEYLLNVIDMALTDEEYKSLGEVEYMIDDVLVEASPISFGAYCEKYSFDSTEYDYDVKGYDVKIFRDAESFHTVFMQRSLFERIAAKSNY